MFLLGNSVDPAAVELTDPVGFSAYIAIAVILYAIRETNFIPTRFLPIIGIVIGLLIAWLQFGFFNADTLIAGIRFGILGVGSVATIKYLLERHENDSKTQIDNKNGNM